MRNWVARLNRLNRVSFINAIESIFPRHTVSHEVLALYWMSWECGVELIKLGDRWLAHSVGCLAPCILIDSLAIVDFAFDWNAKVMCPFWICFEASNSLLSKHCHKCPFMCILIRAQLHHKCGRKSGTQTLAAIKLQSNHRNHIIIMISDVNRKSQIFTNWTNALFFVIGLENRTQWRARTTPNNNQPATTTTTEKCENHIAKNNS